MNRFIMANSQQCLGCHACEIACVMAHLMAYAAQSKKDQRENTDAASQGNCHHQQHFAFSVVL